MSSVSHAATVLDQEFIELYFYIRLSFLWLLFLLGADEASASCDIKCV
jgi:hypothetical protein